MTRPLSSPRGFTLIELLIATALFGVIIAALFVVVDPARDLLAVAPEAQDVQQRLRFGISTLQRAVAVAGAATTTGSYSGAAFQSFAAIRPYRLGDRAPDPAQNVFHRPDTLTVLSIGADAIPARIRSVTVVSPLVMVDVDPNCDGAAVCGFATGARVAAFDIAGRNWFGTVRGVQGTFVEIESLDPEPGMGPETGAILAVVEQATYAAGVDRTTGTPRLTVYDGHLSESPVLDHVVRFGVAYVGESAPPSVRGEDDTAPWLDATYGPSPPGATTQINGLSWPAGENCTFAMIDGRREPRLASLSGGALVAMTPSMLTDGPWCPDETSPNRFDADLLRIRRVDITLRVQVAFASMRGPASLHFLSGGTGAHASRLVPDREIHFAVTPRNLWTGPRR
jgi:prepilin-type N-terminal cleavage/methylation domain-containing protein